MRADLRYIADRLAAVRTVTDGLGPANPESAVSAAVRMTSALTAAGLRSEVADDATDRWVTAMTRFADACSTANHAAAEAEKALCEFEEMTTGE